MAPFNVQSKDCIALIHVRSNLHMEGRHADFAPHIERGHSFRDQIIAKPVTFTIFEENYFKLPISWDLI